MKGHIERDRGYVPHLEIRGATYFITLRLMDTVISLMFVALCRIIFTGY